MNTTKTETSTQTFDGKFTLGEGATACYYSDRKAGTVVAISKSGKTMQVRRDNAVLNNKDELTFSPGGFCAHVSGTQKYDYTPDADGAVTTFSLRSNGKWVEKGQEAHQGTKCIAGRHQFYDYNF